MEDWERELLILRSPDLHRSDKLSYSSKPVQFANDIDVKVLAQAVQDLKFATKREIVRQFNITGNFTWAHATIVAPDFFWTTINPYQFKPNSEPEDPVETYNGGSWHRNLNSLGLRGSAFWLFHMQRKFHVALYQRRFRLEEEPGEPFLFHGGFFRSVFDITSTSRNTLPNTRRYRCSSPEEANNPDSPACPPGALSLASIVITFNNASFSLWPGGLNIASPLWSTFPELGGH